MEFIHEKIDMGYDHLDRAEHADGRRYVTLDGNAYPSVTTVLSIINEEKIAAWRQKVGEEKANQIGTQAANRGTLVHEIIEKYLHNEDTSDYLPHIQQSLKNLKPLLDKHITKVYATECPLYSDYLKLAGTCDCIAEWDGVPTIVDFKTSTSEKKRRLDPKPAKDRASASSSAAYTSEKPFSSDCQRKFWVLFHLARTHSSSRSFDVEPTIA